MGDAISLLSPRQMVEALADPEGDNFSVSYSRLPLSRERTPEAGDVAQLNEVCGGWKCGGRRAKEARGVTDI